MSHDLHAFLPINISSFLPRLDLPEQERVIMEEYNLGWAARAERVNLKFLKFSLVYTLFVRSFVLAFL